MRYRALVTSTITVALGLVVALTPAASASALTAGAATTSQDFNAQARAAGLTAAEAEQLQQRVNTRLEQLGGKQVAANKIVYDTGGFLLLNLPGEKYARELGQPIGIQASCTYTYFCAWSGLDFTGEERAEFRCAVLIIIPWAGSGSWINNQTLGTRANFLRADKSVLSTSFGAPSWTSSFYWTPVFYIDVC